jgi:hypothetical protein
MIIVPDMSRHNRRPHGGCHLRHRRCVHERAHVRTRTSAPTTMAHTMTGACARAYAARCAGDNDDLSPPKATDEDIQIAAYLAMETNTITAAL